MLSKTLVACLPAVFMAQALVAQDVGTGAQPGGDPASETGPVFAGPEANDTDAIPPGTIAVTEEDAPFAVAGALSSRLDAQTLFESDVFEIIPVVAMSTPLLSNARVIDISGENLGGIDAVTTGIDGLRITGIVLTVGGIAGIGDRQVMVPIEATLVGRSDDLNETRIVLAYTEDELSDLPPFVTAD